MLVSLPSVGFQSSPGTFLQRAARATTSPFGLFGQFLLQLKAHHNMGCDPLRSNQSKSHMPCLRRGRTVISSMPYHGGIARFDKYHGDIFIVDGDSDDLSLLVAL